MDACRYTSATSAAELSSKPEKFAMFTRWLTFLICLACAAYLAAEAMPRSVTPPPASLAQPLTQHARAQFQPSDADGRDLLDQALKKLRNVAWLRFTLWQRMHGPRGFEST